MPRINFSQHPATVHNSIVVSFDLEGFSNFCNQPTASITAPKLIKRIFDLLNEMLADQDDSFSTPKTTIQGKLMVPSFIKFTGDGALMMWVYPVNENAPQDFCNLIVETMRDFQIRLAEQLAACEKEWRVNKLPKRIRIGIATGIVYAMRPRHTFTSLTDPNDYVGYCINLAVRLQNHCPELGFLVHGVLHPELNGMEAWEAIDMKGTQIEPVALFHTDACRVPKAEFNRKFFRMIE